MNSKIIQIGIPEPDRCGSTSCQVCFVGERYKYVSHLFQGQLVQLPTLKVSRHNEMAIWISATMWWLHHGDPASQWRWGRTQKYRLLHSNWHRSSWPVFLQQYPQISKASDVTPCTCIKSSYVRNLLGQIAQHVWCSNSFWQSSQFQARSAWLFIRHGPEQSSRFSAKVTGWVGMGKASTGFWSRSNEIHLNRCEVGRGTAMVPTPSRLPHGHRRRLVPGEFRITSWGCSSAC